MLQSRSAEPEELEALYRGWVAGEAPLDSLADSSATLLRAVICRKLRGAAAPGDIEDVCSEALLELLSRLDGVRTGDAPAIERYAGYVASIGYYAVNDYYRRRNPERHKLKNRLRYALKSEFGFALWDAGEEGWLASLARYCKRRTAAIPEQLAAGLSQLSPAEMASAILEAAGAPVPFDALVDRVALLAGIRYQQVPLEDLPARAGGPAFEFAGSWTSYLERLWRTIAQLPLPQRNALLLNLRGDADGSPLALLPATGTASIEDIAAMLGMPALEFAELWGRLPLGDQEIAQRLGLARQQVINLRMSARKRLSRNLPEVIRQLRERLE